MAVYLHLEVFVVWSSIAVDEHTWEITMDYGSVVRIHIGDDQLLLVEKSYYDTLDEEGHQELISLVFPQRSSGTAYIHRLSHGHGWEYHSIASRLFEHLTPEQQKVVIASLGEHEWEQQPCIAIQYREVRLVEYDVIIYTVLAPWCELQGKRNNK
jgi:hypothetical protein